MMTWQESAAWRPEIEGHSIDILPWMFAIESQIPKGGTYVEVGVYKGRSFRFMRELRPDLFMVAIDPFTDESVGPSSGRGEETLDAFMKNMTPFPYWESGVDHWEVQRCTLARAILPTFAKRADLIFIDGSHLYPDVRDDIAAARKIIKPGGIISGHDYAGDNGVCQAVREAFPGKYHVSDFDAPLPGAADGKGRCWHTVIG